jgi:curved DNA-binding protein CbpA
MYFTKSIETLEQLKKEYRRLATTHHPDTKNGNLEIMQKINNEYEEIFKKVKNNFINKEQEIYTKENGETPQEFINIINKLIVLYNIEIEIIGSFIWVIGETKDHKEVLKELNFKWHSKKLCWYLAPKSYIKRSKKNYEMDDLRNMYEVTSVKKNKQLVNL